MWMEAIRVGALSVIPVYDGTAKLNASMFTTPGADETPIAADWSAHRDALDNDGNFSAPVGGFLVRTGDRTVLLDAGIGPVIDEIFNGGELLRSLAALGVQPSDIDTVFISHLHSDHMGWLEQHGKVTFENATIRIGAADWDFFVEEAGMGKKRADRLRVVQSHVELIDADGESIAPGITARSTPGHTPGHTSAVISSGGERLIMLGDLLHCPAQLTETEWQFLYDSDRALASQTRAAVLHEADDPHTSLLPCHFPGMQAARLLRSESEHRWIV
jgi:glyoxylase-like metal-dependent hydrolase (beta-lactamase superfamily II)